MVKARWALVASGVGSRNDRRRAGIYPIEVFKALLSHERSRADREGSRFSLVVMDVTGLSQNGDGVQMVTKNIHGEMRSIDEAGWIDTNGIGILLPATGSEGGRKFASRLFGSLSGAAARIPWAVYTYPDHWLGAVDGSPGEEARTSPPSVAGLFCTRIPGWKRCFDVMGAALCLVLLSPLFLFVAAYIKIVSPGRILFRQTRVGYGGKHFTFLKFRTMSENNDPGAHQQYLKALIRSAEPMQKLDADRDARIIPGGKLVRKACIDELPQLINVLRGEMSLVGPRPCIPYEAAEYLRWHTHRFDILPGMTGLWQVSGKNRLSFEQMIRLDIEYARHLSPLRDLAIILRTVPAIIGMVFEAGMRRLRDRFAPPPPVAGQDTVTEDRLARHA
jgi:lipopolysaccharide/colanic/teichoic acid biosynthesis glycosyltransferase